MKRPRLAIGLGLVALTLAVMGPCLANGFVSIDDPQYITANPMVNRGFSWQGAYWALTTNHLAQWHPLTWFGHMAICHVFGLAPRGHLSLNLLFHVMNVLALFWLLSEATGREGPSALAAALFAIHPLQVESVTWACQLKTLLATFFAFASLIAYVAYARAPGRLAHARVTLAMALSLCSKMMGVTLPCLFLLLDFWPLERVPEGWRRPLPPWPLVREKLPWFALALVGAAVKLVHRAQGHELEMYVQFLPLWVRAGQAFVSYATYPLMMVWPVRLALPYPHPGTDIAPAAVVTAVVAVVLVVTLVVRARVRMPELATGLLWYAGTLVPVIGIVQVGNQALADRFMYLPMVGLLVMVVFGLPERARGRAGVAVAALALLALGLRSRDQLAIWRSNESLLVHTLSVTRENALAHTNLGNVHLLRGENSKALEQYRAAIALNAMMPEAFNNLGLLLVRVGRAEESLPFFERALELRPHAVDSLIRMVKALQAAGKMKEAAARCRAGIRQHPEQAELHALQAMAAIQLGDMAEAAAASREAARIDPAHPRVQVAVGYVALRQARWAEALAAFDAALSAEPGNTMALEGGARALEKLGRTAEALQRALRLAEQSPHDPAVLLFAATLAANGGLLPQALELLERLIRDRPDLADAHFRAAVVLERLGRPVEARRQLAECLRLDPAHPAARRIQDSEDQAAGRPLPPPLPPQF